MTRREERRVRRYVTFAVLDLVDGGTLIMQSTTEAGIDYFRVVSTQDDTVLWRGRVPAERVVMIPPGERVRWFMGILERLAAQRAQASSEAQAGIRPDGGRWPALVEMITFDKNPDGTRRVPSRITLFMEPGVIKAGLRDEAMKASAFRTGCTIEDALDALERALNEGDPDLWKAWPDGGAGWKGKRK